MGSKAQAKQNQEAARRMKDLGVRRRTGGCPLSCGAQFPLGAAGLLSHLVRCNGKRK